MVRGCKSVLITNRKQWRRQDVNAARSFPGHIRSWGWSSGANASASAVKEPGHFEVKNLKPGHRMHYFPQKSWLPFLVVALKTQDDNAANCFTFKINQIKRSDMVTFIPHCMECRRCLVMRILSVCQYVCPTVCQTRALWQNGKNIYVQTFIMV